MTGRSSTLRRFSPRVVQRYVAPGDSFTAGPEGDPTRPWPDYLADALEAVNPALEYHNLAVHGVPSEHVAKEQLERALALQPDLVTVICGANDVLLSVRPDIAAYAITLSEVLGRLRGELPDAIVITATVPDFSRFMPLRPRSRERVARGMGDLNDAIRSVARRRGVHLLEFAEHPQADVRDNFARDGFHPSPDGNRRTAAVVIRSLERHFGIATAGLEVTGVDGLERAAMSRQAS